MCSTKLCARISNSSNVFILTFKSMRSYRLFLKSFLSVDLLVRFSFRFFLMTVKLECHRHVISIGLSICWYFFLSVFMSVGLSVCPTFYLRFSVCLSIYLSVFLSVDLSVGLSICPSFCLSICLSVFLSVHLSVCRSV